MVVGGMMLVEGPIPQLRIQFVTTLAVAIPLSVITVFLLRLVVLSQGRKSITGKQGMIGEIGKAISDIHKTGKVQVHGEYWNAFSSTPIPAGANVRVVKVVRLKVQVEQAQE
jgi:membrane-bound serine protease (ClpP class)